MSKNIEKQPSNFRKWFGKAIEFVGKTLQAFGRFIKQPFAGKWGKIFGIALTVGIVGGTVAATVFSGGATLPVLIPIAIELTAAVAGYVAAKRGGAVTGGVVASSTIAGSKLDSINSVSQYINQSINQHATPTLASIASEQATIGVISGVTSMAAGIGVIASTNRVCKALTGHNIDVVIGDTMVTAGKICMDVGQLISNPISDPSKHKITALSDIQPTINDNMQQAKDKVLSKLVSTIESHPIIENAQTLIKKNQSLISQSANILPSNTKINIENHRKTNSSRSLN